ncbi:hypothetical protein [Saccharicrinis aurantiacus]|uniref:hypothetical protein n=1 Tax=Saccharicrinis aurantiacus TaxID=1849719 RepID=UPI0024904002|nr:hypothetical protein [Saccharicrinis aurantiacus]
MQRYFQLFILLFILFSCAQVSERRVIGKVNVYTHYLSYKLKNERPVFDVDYSYSTLNDSVILLKLYRYGDLKYKSIDLTNDTVDYQKWYLCSKESLKTPTVDYLSDPNLVYSEYFILDFKKEYKIDGKSHDVLSLLIDNDGIDGDLRLFFNEKLGLLAEYSHSGFDARLYWESNEESSNGMRKKLITELIADSIFFPYPIELYSTPRINR